MRKKRGVDCKEKLQIKRVNLKSYKNRRIEYKNL